MTREEVQQSDSGSNQGPVQLAKPVSLADGLVYNHPLSHPTPTAPVDPIDRLHSTSRATFADSANLQLFHSSPHDPAKQQPYLCVTIRTVQRGCRRVLLASNSKVILASFLSAGRTYRGPHTTPNQAPPCLTSPLASSALVHRPSRPLAHSSSEGPTLSRTARSGAWNTEDPPLPWPPKSPLRLISLLLLPSLLHHASYHRSLPYFHPPRIHLVSHYLRSGL